MTVATQTQECLVGVYRGLDEAHVAMQMLDDAGFPRDLATLVTHDISLHLPAMESIQYGDEAEHKAAAGAGVGALLGALLGAPLILIPGVGPAIWIGPLAAGMTGAVVGGLLGAIRGWGIHEDHIQEYEEAVRGGRVLIVVTGEPEEIARAQEVLQDTAPQSLRLHAATPGDAPEIDDR